MLMRILQPTGDQVTGEWRQFHIIMELGQRSRYSDWLRAGRPRSRSSSPGGGKNFHLSMSSSPALRSTQTPTQWVPAALSRG
jgi:hypothetical protein